MRTEKYLLFNRRKARYPVVVTVDLWVTQFFKSYPNIVRKLEEFSINVSNPPFVKILWNEMKSPIFPCIFISLIHNVFVYVCDMKVMYKTKRSKVKKMFGIRDGFGAFANNEALNQYYNLICCLNKEKQANKKASFRFNRSFYYRNR